MQIPHGKGNAGAYFERSDSLPTSQQKGRDSLRERTEELTWLPSPGLGSARRRTGAQARPPWAGFLETYPSAELAPPSRPAGLGVGSRDAGKSSRL